MTEGDGMSPRLFTRIMRNHALALACLCVLTILMGLLYATDRRLGLYQFASTRYRFHAIPVAVSTLYHNRPHDYTAYRILALRFQDAGRDIDDQIREAVRAQHDIGGGTYFWVADDRGLADFVIASFRLFGPRVKSLSKGYFVLFGFTLALFVVGFWRTPVALCLPVFLVLAWLGVSQILLVRVPMQFGKGWWGEEISLYESRLFDVLSLIAALHLAILAAGGLRVSRLAWLTAVPQVAVLVFLYHARSSIGWQYLGLFTLIGARLAWLLLSRWRSSEPNSARQLVRPISVGCLLVLSILGLKQYQREVYHHEYLVDYGQRTFWHNALMGLAYHPELRHELPMGLCDDRNAVELVLAHMEREDPDLDRNQWNWQAALNSLGNHNQFDWDRYEASARTIYFDLWRDRPEQMFMCYSYHKPCDIARQFRLLARRLYSGAGKGLVPEYLIGLGLVVGIFFGVIAVARKSPEHQRWLRSLTRIVAFLIPFSLIPGIAFYPAITTVSCFYLLVSAWVWLVAARLAVALIRRIDQPLAIEHPSGNSS